MPPNWQNTNIEMLGAEQTPNRIKPRKSTARHIKIKFLQTKERKNLESSQRKTMDYLQKNISSNYGGQK